MLNSIQKFKWSLLGYINPNYFVWSLPDHKKEEVIRKSGQEDFKNFVLSDENVTTLLNLKSSSALEIGTGVGRMTRELAKHFKNVHTIDISLPMSMRAQKNLNDVKNVDFHVTNGLIFPIEDNSIDFAFSYIVFQHFPTKEMIFKNLSEVTRVLKPGGVAKIQFRGKKLKNHLPPILTWYYGQHVEVPELTQFIEKSGLMLINLSGEGEKYFWATFQKKS